MKTPNKELLESKMLAVERAVHTALRKNFDESSAGKLTRSLDELLCLVFEEGEELPIQIDRNNPSASKALIMADIAFACWLNDEPDTPMPEGLAANHAVRMRLNREHCKFTLEIARAILLEYERFLSLEAQALR